MSKRREIGTVAAAILGQLAIPAVSARAGGTPAARLAIGARLLKEEAARFK